MMVWPPLQLSFRWQWLWPPFLKRPAGPWHSWLLGSVMVVRVSGWYRHGFLWLGYTRNISGACVHLRLVIIKQEDLEAYLESWCWLDPLRDASLCDSRKSLTAGNQLLGIWPPNLAILVRWTLRPAGVFNSYAPKQCVWMALSWPFGVHLIAIDSVWLVSIGESFWVSVSSSGKMVLVLSTSRTIGRNKGHQRCDVLEQHAS